MKLQIICMLFILLSAATRNLCAFTIQRDVQKDLASLETYKAETTGLQSKFFAFLPTGIARKTQASRQSHSAVQILLGLLWKQGFWLLLSDMKRICPTAMEMLLSL
ncbi:hypothetical protein Chor_005338 [Crotalus horridus]